MNRRKATPSCIRNYWLDRDRFAMVTKMVKIPKMCTMAENNSLALSTVMHWDLTYEMSRWNLSFVLACCLGKTSTISVLKTNFVVYLLIMDDTYKPHKSDFFGLCHNIARCAQNVDRVHNNEAIPALHWIENDCCTTKGYFNDSIKTEMFLVWNGAQVEQRQSFL